MADIYEFRKPETEAWGGYFAQDVLTRPPPRRWIVNAIVPRKVVTLLAGGPKSSKSKILMQLAISATLGLPWVGETVERVPVISLFLEDDREELERRQFAVMDAYGIVSSAEFGPDLVLNPREWLSTKLIHFRRNHYDDPEWTDFGRELWKWVGDLGAGLVIIDTATRAFGCPADWKGDRASNIALLITREAATYDCAVIVVDHTNRADSGSFAGRNTWLGSVRAAMNLRIPIDKNTFEEDRSKRILRDLGGNYGWWDPITLTWDGNLLVPTQNEELAKRPQSHEEREEFNYRCLAYLQKCVKRGILVPVDDTDKMSLPQRIRHSAKPAPVLNDLNNAVDWMLERELASIVRIGSKTLLRPAELRYEGE